MKPREFWFLRMPNKQFYMELDGPHETETTLNLVEKSAYQALEARHKKLLEVLKEINEALVINVNGIEKINFEIHGDLHGCDCEYICNCKPVIWNKLQNLKTHNLGCSILIDDAIEADRKASEE